MKVFWGVDDGNLTESRRFVASLGVVLASALWREGTLGQLRLGPVAETLRANAEEPAVAV